MSIYFSIADLLYKNVFVVLLCISASRGLMQCGNRNRKMSQRDICIKRCNVFLIGWYRYFYGVCKIIQSTYNDE